ncbi:MAG TPA: hypothetical protein VN690_07585 [Terriglobales bacterium]|nr:hypothetical protein [Terriglobales bacterium]
MAKKSSPVWAYLTVLLAAVVGLAMTPLANAQQTQTQPQQQAQQNQQPITATGCLQKASSGNGYQLTDSSTMKTYDLSAASSDVDLSAHVGHTVTVTGTPSAAAASTEQNPPGSATSNPAGQSQTQNQQLSVTNVKMVSSSCQGGK